MTTIDHRRRSISGAAKKTQLAARMLDSDTTATLLDGSTFPSAPSSKFAIVTIDRGETNEERIAYSPRVGNDLQNCVRGADGTTAYTHEAGATVEHSIGAIDIDEANELVAAFSIANAAAANALVTAATTWSTFTPNLRVTGGATFTIATSAVLVSRYQVVGHTCHFEFAGSITLNGANPGGLLFDLPVPAYSGGIPFRCDAFNDAYRCKSTGASGSATSTTADVFAIAGGNFPIGGGYGFGISGTYQIA